MKHSILLVFLLFIRIPVQAQAEYLLVAGAAAGLNALKGHPQKPDEYVTQVSYQGRTFSQKRTPAGKLPSKGGPHITAVEQQLAACYTALLASPTLPVLGPDGEPRLNAALAELQRARPLWSTVAYAEELRFYHEQDVRRDYERRELERRQAYQRQQREQARRDSAERLALRRQWLVDSTRRAVLAQVRAQADSVARATAAHQAGNAGQEAVTIESLAPALRTTASSYRPAAARTTATKKVVMKAKRSAGPSVYYCASGNTVKYHASPTCRGLSRCGASVLPISLREAQQQMDPCKWCY